MEIKSQSAGGRKNISDHESQAGAMDLDAIVERACQGDTEALAEIYRRFSPRVLGLCRHMLGSKEAAEDAMSEVFLRVQRATASYNGSVPFLSWLYSIASHHCVDLLRRRQVERRFVVEENSELEPMSKSTLSPMHEVILTEQRGEVRKAIAGLPEKYRLPLVLRYYSDFSYDEIARQLGFQRAHVATLIFRGKQELRRILSEYTREVTSR